MKGDDLLAIVEAAYRLDGTDSEWLEGVATACRPALDEGFGLCAFEFRYRMGAAPQIVAAQKVGIPDELAQLYGTVFRTMEPAVQVRPFTHGPCITASQMMGQRDEFKDNPHMQRYAQRFGMYDSIWITAAEPSGTGCGLHAGRPRIGWVSQSTRERWARLCAHLSAGTRLRRRVAAALAGQVTPSTAEAVLSPDGRVLHAEGEAREPEARQTLRRAVLGLEKARGPARLQDVMTSLQAWQGLVDGRWSLLDQFESDGRRYVVARENTPQAPGPAALTLRERQIVAYAAVGHDNKVIAYDLGIAHATVKVLMARAAAKLGVRTRAQTISAYLAACGTSEAPAPASAP